MSGNGVAIIIEEHTANCGFRFRLCPVCEQKFPSPEIETLYLQNHLVEHLCFKRSVFHVGNIGSGVSDFGNCTISESPDLSNPLDERTLRRKALSLFKTCDSETVLPYLSFNCDRSCPGGPFDHVRFSCPFCFFDASNDSKAIKEHIIKTHVSLAIMFKKIRRFGIFYRSQ